jgi:hypothetical protein
LGEVLMQLGKPMAYLSKAIVPKLASMSIYKKEDMAILEALKKLHHYLLWTDY